MAIFFGVAVATFGPCSILKFKCVSIDDRVPVYVTVGFFFFVLVGGAGIGTGFGTPGAI